MVWSSFFRTCHGGDSLKWLLLDLHNVIKQRSLCQHWRLNQSCGGAQRSLASYLDGDSVLIMLKCILSVDDSLQLVFVSRNWSYEAVMAISCQFCSGTTVSYMPLYNTFDWHEAVRFFGGVTHFLVVVYYYYYVMLLIDWFQTVVVKSITVGHIKYKEQKLLGKRFIWKFQKMFILEDPRK